jgi:hypothetical protein
VAVLKTVLADHEPELETGCGVGAVISDSSWIGEIILLGSFSRPLNYIKAGLILDRHHLLLPRSGLSYSSNKVVGC